MTDSPDSVPPDARELDAEDALDEGAESGVVGDAAAVDEDRDADVEDRTGSTMVPPDRKDDPARSPLTMGIDNTDTALGPEDSSSAVE